jgi:hypothetical protein
LLQVEKKHGVRGINHPLTVDLTPDCAHQRIKLTVTNNFHKTGKSCNAFGMPREYILLHTIFSLAILLMAVLMAVAIGAG